MQSPQFGYQPILITRPKPRGEVLAQALCDAGFVVEQLELMQLIINPMIPSWLVDFYYDWLIFTSPMAITALAAQLPVWPSALTRAQIACIGSASQQLISHWFKRTSLCEPIRANSEALLSMSALQQVSGQQILLIEGDLTRDLLAKTLIARGAKIHHWPIYRSESQQLPQCQRDRLQQGDYLALIVTSEQQLKWLQTALNSLALARPIIVSSSRLLLFAQKIGFKTCWQAQNATIKALVATCQKRLLE